MAKRNPHQSKDLDAYSLSLLKIIVGKCLRSQGLPSDEAAVDAIIELIDAGFVHVQGRGDEYWLEAI